MGGVLGVTKIHSKHVGNCQRINLLIKIKLYLITTCKIVLNSEQKGSGPNFRERDMLPEGASQELWGPHG